MSQIRAILLDGTFYIERTLDQFYPTLIVPIIRWDTAKSVFEDAEPDYGQPVDYRARFKCIAFDQTKRVAVYRREP